jgi:hypothetical protein
MSAWSEGYVSEIGYTYGYFPVLNPLQARLAFTCAGLKFPEVHTACEIGFGQGLSINIHAAASSVQWTGNDFAPDQVAFAREMAAASGSGARLLEDSFAELAARTDLPQFDFIALHGIWSWISDENRNAIIDVISKRLNVGGVVYVSYNTLPGWAPLAPVQNLLRQHADVMGSEGEGVLGRIDSALGFAEKLMATSPRYALAVPHVTKFLTDLKGKNRTYVAHEYFNRHWNPMHFSDVVGQLTPAKMTYACSATLLDHIYPLHLTPEQIEFLGGIPESNFRESILDFMLHQQFRRDYWVKGARRMAAPERAEALRQLRLVLSTPPHLVPMKLTGRLGEVELSAATYQPILEAMGDHKPRTLGQIEAATQTAGLAFEQLLQGVMVLAGSGHVCPANDDAVITTARKRTDRLNQHLLQLARTSDKVTYLASPVTGEGLMTNHLEQLLLLARTKGHKTPADWASFVWSMWKMTGQKVVKEGKTLDTQEENLAELTAMAKVFHDAGLPRLRALQVV